MSSSLKMSSSAPSWNDAAAVMDRIVLPATAVAALSKFWRFQSSYSERNMCVAEAVLSLDAARREYISTR
jgi:hypothetical protein